MCHVCLYHTLHQTSIPEHLFLKVARPCLWKCLAAISRYHTMTPSQLVGIVAFCGVTAGRHQRSSGLDDQIFLWGACSRRFFRRLGPGQHQSALMSPSAASFFAWNWALALSKLFFGFSMSSQDRLSDLAHTLPPEKLSELKFKQVPSVSPFPSPAASQHWTPNLHHHHLDDLLSRIFTTKHCKTTLQNNPSNLTMYLAGHPSKEWFRLKTKPKIIFPPHSHHFPASFPMSFRTSGPPGPPVKVGAWVGILPAKRSILHWAELGIAQNFWPHQDFYPAQAGFSAPTGGFEPGVPLSFKQHLAQQPRLRRRGSRSLGERLAPWSHPTAENSGWLSQ